MTQNVTPILKHQEFILAVSNAFLNDMRVNQHDVEKDDQKLRQIIPFDFPQFCTKALPELIVSQRLGLETDSTKRQLLPYVILTQKDKEGVKKYINYNRAKGSGEQRLLGGRSVGFGGHIEYNDIVGNNNLSGQIDLGKTILNSTDREMSEELTVKYNEYTLTVDQYLPIMQLKYLILSDDEKVGIYHVGLVVEAEIHPDFVVSSEEDAIEMRESATAEELLAQPELEDWSRLFLEFQTKEGTEYTFGTNLIVRPNSIYSLISKIGEANFQKIESLMQQLISNPTEEEAIALRAELESMGYIDLIETPQGLRWRLNEDSFEQMKLKQELESVLANNAEQDALAEQSSAVEESTSENNG